MSNLGLNPTTIFKISLPWVMNALGLTKMLRERWIRCPQANLPDAVANANTLLGANEQMTANQWRAVEATQSQILGDGIIARITPR